MKNCKKCRNEIKELNLREEIKSEIWTMMKNSLKIFAIKKLMEECKLNHKEAKVVIAHWNKEFGKCHRCNFANLEKEYIECPQCKAFNYNFKVTSII